MQTPCGGRPCNCGLRIIEKQGFVAERKGILHSITCCVRMVIERVIIWNCMKAKLLS